MQSSRLDFAHGSNPCAFKPQDSYVVMPLKISTACTSTIDNSKAGLDTRGFCNTDKNFFGDCNIKIPLYTQTNQTFLNRKLEAETS